MNELFPTSVSDAMHTDPGVADGSYKSRNRIKKFQIKTSKLNEPPIKKSSRKFKIDPITNEVISHPLDLPQTEHDLRLVAHQLQFIRQQHVDSQEYPEAQHIQRILSSIERQLISNEKKDNRTQRVDSLLCKKEELEVIINTLVSDWNREYQEFWKTTKFGAEMIRKRQSEELEAYDQSFPKELPPSYRKGSSTLLKMRNKERALALSNDFEGAYQFKAAADEQERKEAEIKTQQLRSDFLEGRRKLKVKHKHELAIYFTHAEETRQGMVQQKESLIEGYHKRINLIEKEVSNIKGGKTALKSRCRCSRLSKDRAEHVCENEYSYPIPRIRPGTAFNHVRCEEKTDLEIKPKKRQKRVDPFSDIF